MKRHSIAIGGLLLCVFAQPLAAHFRLLSPAPWIQESNAFGDPQWSSPCGGTLTEPGIPTGTVTKFRGGDVVHVRIREMAFHPGFYRVALSVNSRRELPPDPEPISITGTDGRQLSVAGTIRYPPVPPVLADGLFMHDSPFTADQDADIPLPNISCTKCTLQVIEFMAAHVRNPDGEYTYHHCADLQITADASKPIDTRFPSEYAQH